jgi:hypothetical protein
MWNNQELEMFWNYQRLSNYYFEPVWCDIEIDQLERLQYEAEKKLMQVNKPVKVYKDYKYLKTVQLSAVKFIEDIFSKSLIIWIPVNFENLKEFRKKIENMKVEN